LDQQNKRPKKEPTSAVSDSSAFRALFLQRAQGFRIDFSFRNAPPRPPVGPCFVGQGLDGQLQELANYRHHNAVEVNYSWKLHAELDLGVPLAPSAMNLQMYEKPTSDPPAVHPDDEALLQWKGSMGDSATEFLQKTKDTKRAAARLALAGKAMPIAPQAPQFQKKQGSARKEFSRVLDHGMVFFMKKTTYLSNDYSRKVHDFTSLATTNKRRADELNVKQRQLDKSAKSVEKTFGEIKLVHPSGNKKRKALWDVPLLPNVEHWGHAYTHVVMDNPPKSGSTENLDKAFVAHVEQRHANARMSCQLLVPSSQQEKDYRSAAQYDLDVLPLKESEDSATSNFCLWMSKEEATYLPIPSRVQLSTGRPGKKALVTTITRKTDEEPDEEFLERMAQVDRDVSSKQETSQKDDDAGFGVLDDDDDDDDED
jgi:hypothetical protein